jgi:hypothetical protein
MGGDAFLARRRVISALGAGAVLAAAGCAPTVGTSQADYPRAYSRKPWAATGNCSSLLTPGLAYEECYSGSFRCRSWPL